MSKMTSPWKPVVNEFFTNVQEGIDLLAAYHAGALTANKVVTHPKLITHLKTEWDESRVQNVTALPAKNSILKWVEDFGVKGKTLKEEKVFAERRKFITTAKSELEAIYEEYNHIGKQVEALLLKQAEAKATAEKEGQYWQDAIDDYYRKNPDQNPNTPQTTADETEELSLTSY